MSEQDREFSKDAKDLNEYYSFHEQSYKYQDPISEEDILRRKESKEREKQLEDFKRDQDFYYKKDRKKKFNLFFANIVHLLMSFQAEELFLSRSIFK